MKTVGLIRGLSFESEGAYLSAGFREIDGEGPAAGADGLISLDLNRDEVWKIFEDCGWNGVGGLALKAARRLKNAGAEMLALAGCAGHKVADRIKAGTGLPLLHIADPLGAEAARLGAGAIGLLGARFTLSDGHLRDRLKDGCKLRVLVPEPADIEIVQSIIHGELLKGGVEEESRTEVRRIMGVLQDSGAQAVALAFSDLARLIRPEDTPLPLLEAASLHAAALAKEAGG